MGPNTEFVTRSAALKKLQITLKDFRRLCILKGVYPRVPTKAPKGSDKVHCDIKDISFIMHEPLLNKFREFKSFMKKIRNASGRNQFAEARRKDALKPKFTLDHLVKERYPRFIDALRDLDDALCMIHLFAALPSEGRITPERTAACSELARHWQYYISKSRTLHKVFVSVKGVYYQAEIMGEPINWLVPHQFTQSLPKEVDIRVMLTFLEFYETFVKFVLFKLYNTQGMVYPPKVDAHLQGEGCFLLAMKSDLIDNAPKTETAETVVTTTVEKNDTKSKKSAPTAQEQASAARLPSLQKKLQQMAGEDEDEEDEELGAEMTVPLAAAFGGLQSSVDAENDEGIEESERAVFASSSDDPRTRLFSKLVFFINREVPLEWLQFCTVSFGAKVGWEGGISPIKADDPRITHHVVDRPISADKLLKNREYVQPQWVFDCVNAQMLLPVGNYLPGAKLPPHLSPFVDDEKEGYLPRYREEIRKLQAPVKKGVKRSLNSDEEEENDSASEDDVAPIPLDSKKGPKGIVHAPKAGKKVTEDEEANDLSKIMMSKKTKRLYGRMQHGIAKKQ
eukprot:gene29685-36772_t